LDLSKKLCQDDKLQDFRLVGGTALALQFGHRSSIDIDLFSNKDFNAGVIHDHILRTYNQSTSRNTTNSVMCSINNIKVDMIAHRYHWLKPPFQSEGLRMASPKDIAAMKIHAIYNAGNRQKDFVDLYYLLEKFPLNEMIQLYKQKYPDGFPNIAIESVRSFDRLAIDDQIIISGKQVPWNEIEIRLKEAVMNPNKVFKENFKNLLPKKRNDPGDHRKKPKL
jgi:hypothetical protein